MIYNGIGKIIGMPIDRLVIDISRRGTVEYFNTLIPPEGWTCPGLTPT